MMIVCLIHMMIVLHEQKCQPQLRSHCDVNDALLVRLVYDSAYTVKPNTHLLILKKQSNPGKLPTLGVEIALGEV